jgi:hypothetical protein
MIDDSGSLTGVRRTPLVDRADRVATIAAPCGSERLQTALRVLGVEKREREEEVAREVTRDER